MKITPKPMTEEDFLKRTEAVIEYHACDHGGPVCGMRIGLEAVDRKLLHLIVRRTGLSRDEVVRAMLNAALRVPAGTWAPTGHLDEYSLSDRIIDAFKSSPRATKA